MTESPTFEMTLPQKGKSNVRGAAERSDAELAQWLEALHPEVMAEQRATAADRKFALWVCQVAGRAAVELLREEA